MTHNYSKNYNQRFKWNILVQRYKTNGNEKNGFERDYNELVEMYKGNSNERMDCQ